MNIRNKIADTLFGMCFVVTGVGLAGNAFGIWSYKDFFDGWWTLFIIVPMLISIFKSGFHMFNSIVLFIGVILLLSSRDIIPGDIIYNMIVPIILVVIGLQILFRGPIRKRFIKKLADKGKKVSINVKDYVAVFGANDQVISGEPFNGANAIAVFGGVELDLRDAIINGDISINCSAIFGGIEIKIPKGVQIEISSVPIFGGVSNKTVNALADSPKIFINATCIFGGVDVI